MTVIVYKNYVMASDSSCWKESTEICKVKKIYRIRKGLVGIAGDFTDIAKFIKWLKEGAVEEEYPKGTFEAIVVDPSNRITLWDGWGYAPINHRGNYCAVGSGADIALGALCVGASSKQAVQAAIKHHSQCSGPISLYKLNNKD